MDIARLLIRLYDKYFKKEIKIHNKYDAYTKVMKSIKSCKKPQQIGKPITNLIRNFKDMYDDSYLTELLYDERDYIRMKK